MPIKSVGSIKRALLVLEEIAAAQPVGVSVIARSLGLTKSSTQRALISLAEAGWIGKDRSGGAEWVLTTRALGVVLGATQREGLRETLLPTLTSLRDASGETVFLALAHRDRVVLAEVVESANVIRVAVPIHTAAPAADKSAVLAIAAFLDRAARARLLGSKHRAAVLQTDLDDIRRLGYASQYRAVRADIHTVAVPVFDRHGVPIAAVGLSAPAERMSTTDAANLGRLAADLVSAGGFGPPPMTPSS